MKQLSVIKKIEDAVQREKASLEKRINELDGRWEDGRPNLFQGWQFDEPMDEDIYVHKGKKLIRRHLPMKGKEAQCRAS